MLKPRALVADTFVLVDFTGSRGDYPRVLFPDGRVVMWPTETLEIVEKAHRRVQDLCDCGTT